MWWQRLSDLLGFSVFLGLRLPQNDQVFITSYLDEAGQFLFSQMSIMDQKHSVRVARYIIQEAAFKSGINLDRLVQAALLHDVGKIKGDINRLNRILVGVIRRLCPGRRRKWGRRDRSSSFRYSLYVDLIHPSRGAYMAESMGIDSRVVALIKKHHDPELTEDNDLELSLLKSADKKS